MTEPAHAVEIGLGEDQRHVVRLLEPDPVLARDGAAHLGADLEDLPARRHHPRLRARLAGIVEEVRVQIAVAGMEDIADAEAMGRRDLVHPPQHIGELGARDDAIHHHVGGRDVPIGAEGGLAPLPEEIALRRVPRHPHLARAGLAAGLGDALGLLVHAGGEAVHLDEERGGGIARIAAAEGVLHRPDGELIDHLHRGGHQPAGDDGGHRRRGVVHHVEDREHGLDRRRLLHDADDDLGGDAEGALGADEEPGEVIALRIARLAADPDHLAVREHHFQAQHVVGGDAVLERVRAARVVGDIAADGAGLLAGGIRRVVEALRADGPGEMQVDEPRLHHRELIRVVHFQHAVHPHQGDDEAALGGEAAASGLAVSGGFTAAFAQALKRTPGEIPAGRPRSRPARGRG